MEELKNVWLRQDAVGRTVMVSGLVAALACLVLGRGWLAVALMGAMAVCCCIYARTRARRRYRTYGVLYYTLPDGEEVALPLGDLEKRHVGREFILRCPYDGTNADGDWDTGFGLVLDMSACEAYPKLRRGQMMVARGTLSGEAGAYYLAVHSCIRL